MGRFTGLAGLLDGPAEDDPTRAALVMDDGTVWSYGDLRDLTDRWVATLSVSGVGPGDRVTLADRAGPRSTAVTLGAVMLGAATAQMNPALTEPELAALIEVAGCGPVAVAADDAAHAVGAALRSAGHDAAVLLDRPDDAADAADADSADDGAVALVLFTSGTTGTPKAVPITDAAVMARMGAYRAPFDVGRAPNVSIMCVPSFHIGGMLGLLLNLYGGDTTVVMPRFDAGRWLELVQEQQVTSAFLVPTMLARILDHPAAQPGADAADVSSLRVVAYGAAAAPVDLVQRAMERWPHVGFANVFGQTETLGAYTTLGPDDHRDPARIGSVGRPLPGVELRIVDPATGVDLADDQVGELWLRSAQTVAADAGDGWFATGDLARRDGGGYLYPTGRMSETINRGGEKFSPGEVADAVRSHPAVAEVAVAGIADPEMGERVGVAVVPVDGALPPTLDEFRDHCRDRLAPYKLPEVLAVVEELPHNELGKLPARAVAELIVSIVAPDHAD